MKYKSKKYFKEEAFQTSLIEQYRIEFLNLTLVKNHKMVNTLFDSIKEKNTEEKAIYLHAISKFRHNFFNFFANIDLLTKRKIIETFLFNKSDREKSLVLINGTNCRYIGNDRWISKLLNQLYMAVAKKYIIDTAQALKSAYNIILKV